MPCKYLSTRLVTVCEDVILPGAAGPNVRIFLFAAYSVQAIGHVVHVGAITT